LYRLKQYQL